MIFLTAKAVGNEVERMTALGAAGVLIKPFDPRTLSETCERWSIGDGLYDEAGHA